MSFQDVIQTRYQGLALKDAFQETAWLDYQRMGLPQAKSEWWKYSNLNQITKHAWTSPTGVSAISPAILARREAHREIFDVLIFVNGILNRKESVISEELAGLLVQKPVGPLQFDDGFASLTAAISQPLYHLHIPEATVVERPILILQGQVGEGTWASSSFAINLGQRSELQIAEHISGEGTYLRTQIGHVQLASQAKLNWLRVQNESSTASHFSDIRVTLGESAQLALSQVNAGGQWSRSAITVDINERFAEARVQGLSFGDQKEHIDQRVVINHRAGDTTSSQLFKGILAGHSRGILNGKIYIAPGAQKVNSSQLNHNILVGPNAEADTKPELEIYADDVKANHGASIGRVDGDKLFYLQSRGLPKQVAERLLVEAFASDVVMKIGAPKLRSLCLQWMKEFN